MPKNHLNPDAQSIEECLSPHSEIATKLRRFFSQIEQETLPEQYLDLLNKLDQAEQEQSSSK